jgi:hypothetical protein
MTPKTKPRARRPLLHAEFRLIERRKGEWLRWIVRVGDGELFGSEWLTAPSNIPASAADGTRTPAWPYHGISRPNLVAYFSAISPGPSADARDALSPLFGG